MVVDAHDSVRFVLPIMRRTIPPVWPERQSESCLAEGPASALPVIRDESALAPACHSDMSPASDPASCSQGAAEERFQDWFRAPQCGTRYRPSQSKDLLRHGFYGSPDFRTKWRTKGKLLAFNAVNQQCLRQTSHDACQFDRLAHAESMRGTGKNIFRQPVCVHVPYRNLTGRS